MGAFLSFVVIIDSFFLNSIKKSPLPIIRCELGSPIVFIGGYQPGKKTAFISYVSMPERTLGIVSVSARAAQSHLFSFDFDTDPDAGYMPPIASMHKCNQLVS